MRAWDVFNGLDTNITLCSGLCSIELKSAGLHLQFSEESVGILCVENESVYMMNRVSGLVDLDRWIQAHRVCHELDIHEKALLARSNLYCLEVAMLYNYSVGIQVTGKPFQLVFNCRIHWNRVHLLDVTVENKMLIMIE